MVYVISYMLSSCDEHVTNLTHDKSEIIMFYIETKGYVDTSDQMGSLLSYSRNTNRWPIIMF